MGTGVLIAVVVVLVLLFAGALVLIWRLYTDSARRADQALRMVEAERARTVEQQAALRRYEVAFASITGRGELGEQVLVETAKSLGLREGVHFSVQTDLAGGGAARPDLVLSSDFIVGHPGERAADFEATLALVREVGFAQAYSFKYSPRPGTPAASAPHAVPEAEKDARLQALQALLRDQQEAFNRSLVGRTIPVLLAGTGRHHGQVAGRSPWLNPVHLFASAALIGQVVPVRVLAAHTNSLSGALAAGAATEVSARQRREEPAPA